MSCCSDYFTSPDFAELNNILAMIVNSACGTQTTTSSPTTTMTTTMPPHYGTLAFCSFAFFYVEKVATF